jgi:crossover junction endodeoxyribonuclease RuvC
MAMGIGSGNILALDLGSSCGFALSDEANNFLLSGTWELKNSRHEGGGSRYLRFNQTLWDLHVLHTCTNAPIARVYYELVRRHAGTDAAHVYGGLLAILTSFCEEHGIAYEGVPVGTIKKFWTGKGNASKEMMIAQAVERGHDVDDDNEADAIAILYWAFHNRTTP